MAATAVDPTKDAAVDLRKNRVRRDVEARIYTTLVKVGIPLTALNLARRARVTLIQAVHALAALIVKGKVRKVWSEARETDVYIVAEPGPPA